MTEITNFRLRVKGDVQGVGFRDWTIRQAKARSLNGWVRNRSDGSVELLISGPDPVIRDMLAACTQGPPSAAVENIDIHNEKDPPPEGFVRKPTL